MSDFWPEEQKQKPTEPTDERQRSGMKHWDIATDVNRFRMSQAPVLKKKLSHIVENESSITFNEETDSIQDTLGSKRINKLIKSSNNQPSDTLQRVVSINESSFTQPEKNMSEEAVGIDGFNKRINGQGTSKTRPLTSALKLPSNSIQHRLSIETDPNPIISMNAKKPSSLIQLNRNKTSSEKNSQTTSQVMIDVSTSSSEEVTLDNDQDTNLFVADLGNNGNLNEAKKQLQRKIKVISSVSQNIIDKDYDRNTSGASKLGIVSYRNKLNKEATPISSKSNVVYSKYKKRVSLSSPYEETFSGFSRVQRPPYDSISDAVTCSIGVPSTNLSISETKLPTESIKVTSVSKYQIESPYEKYAVGEVQAHLSTLGIVSEKCGINGKDSRSTIRSDKMVSTSALKVTNRGNKSSQSDSCECWKVCTCKPKRYNSGTEQAQLLTPCKDRQAITCIITNNGSAPKRCTATYSFSYDNLHKDRDP